MKRTLSPRFFVSILTAIIALVALLAIPASAGAASGSGVASCSPTTASIQLAKLFATKQLVSINDLRWKFCSFDPSHASSTVVQSELGKVFKITNTNYNDSRERLPFKVLPSRMYYAAASIKPTGVVSDPQGKGDACASMGVEGLNYSVTGLDQFQQSPGLCDTHDWTAVSFKFCTPSQSANESVIYFNNRIGGFERPAKGEAEFKDYEVTLLKASC